MKDIKTLIQSPELRKYAAETRARNRNAIAEFLAPTVPVPPTFRYIKKWNAGETPVVINTRRAVGGASPRINVFEQDEALSPAPHAVEAVIDRMYLDGDEEQSLFMLRQALDLIAVESELGRERAALTKASATAGAGTDVTWGANDDPVELLDALLLGLMKQAGSPAAGVLFGADAFHTFKHHPLVKGRIKSGLSHAECPGLFHGSSRFEATYGVEKTDGADSVDFILKNSILIFARTAAPNASSRDWLKSVESNPGQQVPQVRMDGRDAVVWCSWEQSVELANEAGVVRLNLVS